MRDHNNLIKPNAGFSLFELMTVVAIIAIASALAVPNVIAWRQNAKMKSAVNSVYGDLQYAKFTAIKQSNWIAVQFYPNRYEIFLDDGDQVQEAGERVIKTVTMPAGVTIDSTTFASDRTGFDRRGLPDEDTLDVATRTGRVNLLGPSSITRRITLTRLGRLD
jgi:type IV fimbrial biogenesis protein FimT